MSEKTILEYAFEYVDLGWAIIPVHSVTFDADGDPLCTCRKNDCPSIGKHPHFDPKWIPNGVKNASKDKKLIEKWWKLWPDANIGVATGAESGIDVIDLDVNMETGEDGIKILSLLANENGGETSIPRTPTQRTGGGGAQIFFMYSRGVIKGKTKIAPGMDTRSDGNYVVVPPSIHKTGHRYEWLISPKDLPPQMLPDWMIEFFSNPSPLLKKILPRASKLKNAPITRTDEDFERLDPELILQGVPKGTRNNTLFRYACSMRSRGFTREEAWLLIQRAASACRPPMSEREAAGCLESAWKYPGAKNEEFLPLTDTGNAERFCRQHRHVARYCGGQGVWYVWNGMRWFRDKNVFVQELAIQTARSILTEVSDLVDKDTRIRFIKHAVASENRRGIEAMISLARGKMPIGEDELDPDPWLINCRNGILNLKTGELSDHDPSKFCTKICNVAYNENAPKPNRWLEFLRKVMADNEELIDFIWRALGYTLTGTTSEQCLFLCHGTGRNGKSTFLEVVRNIIGDYANIMGFESIMLSYGNMPTSSTADIAKLVGVRMAIAIETDPGKRLNETLIKSLTGGDRISARFLYHNPFDFTPAFKIWLACNHRPAIRGQDLAIWRRIKVVPWEVEIPEKEVDPYLKNKLLEERESIFRWMVEGCWEYQKRGLADVVKVAIATADYKDDMDYLGEFIKDCCIIDVRVSESISTLYNAYLEWAQKNNEKHVLGKKTFSQSIEERGFKKERDQKRRYFRGIGLLANENDIACAERHAEPLRNYS